MARPWWTTWPRKYWTEIDWRQWEKEGKPRLPPDMLTQPPPPIPSPPTPPPGPQPSFGLFPKPRPRGREVRGAQSRGVDKLLEELGVR